MASLCHPGDYRCPMSDSEFPGESEPPVVELIGPIQMLTFAFAGNRFKGEILPEVSSASSATRSSGSSTC